MNSALEESKGYATTVLKAIDIINLVGAHPMTFTEICAATHSNKSTIHRLLSTLEYAGYIEKCADLRCYRIGIKLVQLCSLRINDMELMTEAKPYLLDLAKDINQAVHLAVMKEDQAMFIDKIDTTNTIRMYSAIGRSIPLHCSAIGKSLLLDRGDTEIMAILERTPMQRFTSDTLTDPSAVLEQIHNARNTGFTIDNFEHEENVCCIAAPIYDYRQKIIAAISTASRENVFLKREQLILSLKATARKISNCLGYSEHRHLR